MGCSSSLASTRLASLLCMTVLARANVQIVSNHARKRRVKLSSNQGLKASRLAQRFREEEGQVWHIEIHVGCAPRAFLSRALSSAPKIGFLSVQEPVRPA
jgi:hypothetical protein